MAKMISDRAHIAMDVVSSSEDNPEATERAMKVLRDEYHKNYPPTDDMNMTERRLHNAYWNIMQLEVSAAENAISSARDMCYMVLAAVEEDGEEPMATIRWMANRWIENHGKDWMQEETKEN